MTKTRRATSSVERQAVLRVIFGLMRTQKVSARQLARESGLSRSYLDRRLNGELAFSVEDLAALAPILGVGLHQILAATAELLWRENHQHHRTRTQEVSNARYDRQRS